MGKKVIQDIVSNQDAVKSSSQGEVKDASAFFSKRRPLSPPPYVPDTLERVSSSGDRRKRIYVRIIIGILCALCILAIIWFVSGYFKTATVLVTRKSISVPINISLVAEKGNTEKDALGYTLISIEEKLEKPVPATETKYIERKSTGTIVVYNNFSSEPQSLLKNTRFQTPEGKVYRIANRVTIPGLTTSGGNSIPGSIEVEVQADQPGEAYDIGLSDFTLPGFKDSDPARYKKIYARSKTEIRGGVAGEVMVVSDDVLANTRKELQKNLEKVIYDRIQLELPKGYIFFTNLSKIDYRAIDEFQKEDAGGGDDQYIVKELAVLSGVVFELGQFSETLARESLTSYSGEPLTLNNLSDMRVTSVTSIESAIVGSRFSFHVEGSGQFVWNLDSEALKKSLSGIRQLIDNEQAVYSALPSIEQASARISPPWFRTFPDNPEKIKVVIDSEKNP